MKKILMGCLILASLAACCKQHAKNEGIVLYPASAFDTTIHGKAVSLYTLRNANGMTAQITNYGGIIVDLWVPAKGDSFCNVVLGYSSIQEYLTPGNNFAGAITGRFANRIANGRFTLDSVEYNLPINNGPNTLHGGIEGFSKKVWDVCDVTTEDGEQALMLTYVSKDGEENFPGTLTTVVTYSLTPDNQLRIDYSATSDKPTVLNLTNHSYFNLHGGDHKTSVNSHQLLLQCDQYTPTDSTLIPTGALTSVQGTALDFRAAATIGSKVMNADTVFNYRDGYDHNYVIRGATPGKLLPAAQVCEPATGIVMNVMTDAPGIQIFTGKSRIAQDESLPTYGSAIALEAQNYPDAPNHANFPSAVLRPGETYHQTTLYGFAVMPSR